MGFVERMRWWQWVALSLLLGALLGYLNSGGADPSAVHSSMSLMVFEESLLHEPYVDPAQPGKQVPWVSNVVIHPVQDLQIGSKVLQLQLVTFDSLSAPDATHPKIWREPKSLLAPFPYEPMPRHQPSSNLLEYPAVTSYEGQEGDTLNSVIEHFYHKVTPQGTKAMIDANRDFRNAKTVSDMKIDENRKYWIPWNPENGRTVSDFLVATNKFIAGERGAAATPIPFRYTWWESPKHVFQIWMIGTFLIVGVIWPTLLYFMVTGGLGKTNPEEFKLSRYKAAKVSSSVPMAKVVTQDDMQKLRDLEQSLEASLKSSGPAGAPPAETRPVPAVAPVTLLKGGPATEAPAAVPTPEEQKSYTGEFYPVAHPNEKKDKSR